MTNSLAFTLLMLHRLLGEADFAVRELSLPEPSPLRAGQVRHLFVSSPWVLPELNGVIHLERFAFSFGEDRFQIANLQQVRMTGWPALAGQVSELDTNSAFQLATQWLGALKVDVAALQRAGKPIVTQYTLPKAVLHKGRPIPAPQAELVPLPVFSVRMGEAQVFRGNRSTPEYPAQIRLLGTTKELIDVRVQGADFLKRKFISIPGARVIARYADEVTRRMTNRPGFKLADIESLVQPSTERLEQAKPLLLAEANRMRHALDLRDADWSAAQIEHLFISPAAFGRGAEITLPDFYFYFDETGRLERLVRTTAFAPLDAASDPPRHFDLLQGELGLTSGEIQQRAVECLEKLGWGSDQFGQGSPLQVSQMRQPIATPRLNPLLPVFRASWGSLTNRVLEMHFSGKSGALLRLQVFRPEMVNAAPLSSLTSDLKTSRR